MLLTLKYKLRGGGKTLRVASAKINWIWNFCNETSFKAIQSDGRFLTGFDLNNLTAETSKLLRLHSQSIQAVCEQYALKCKAAKKRKVKWRKSVGAKRSLGWVPFKKSGIKIKGDQISFGQKTFRFSNTER